MNKLYITDQPTVLCPMDKDFRFSWKCKRCIHYKGTDRIPVRLNCNYKED